MERIMLKTTHQRTKDDSMSVLMALGKTDQYQKGYKVFVAHTQTQPWAQWLGSCVYMYSVVGSFHLSPIFTVAKEIIKPKCTK